MKPDYKAAVFILLGQSNAVGHGLPMDEQDKISVPLKTFLVCIEEIINPSPTNDSLGADIPAQA